LATDSYCERCGARYVFQAPPKTLSVKNARVLARGLRNFVLNDGQSFADSMTLARTEDETADSTRVTQAFHKAFNFCMTCRQYACEQCWNPKQGACLTCAPDPTISPVAHDNRLLVRTPLTLIDVDGSVEPGYGVPLFGDLPGQLPPVPGQTSSIFDRRDAFDAPAQRTTPAMPTMAASRATGPEAWPAADLEAPVDVPDSMQPSERQPEWMRRRGSADGEGPVDRQESWTLWPISDPLAPEATLTPQELTLVHAQLIEADQPAAASAAESAAGPAAGTPAQTAEAATPGIAPAPPAPTAMQSAAARAAAAAQAAAAAAQAAAAARAAIVPASEEVAPPATQPAPATPATPAAPTAPAAHVTPTTSATPTAPTAPGAPAPHEDRPLVSRLLGQIGRRTDATLTPMAQRGMPSENPWPHPTAWQDRRVRAHTPIDEPPAETTADWPTEPAAAPIAEAFVAAAPAGEPAVSSTAPSPEPEPIAASQAEPEPLVGSEPAAWEFAVTPAPAAPTPAPAAPAPLAPAPTPAPLAPAPLASEVVAPPVLVDPAAAAVAIPSPVPPAPAYVEQPAGVWPPIGAQYPTPTAPTEVWPSPADPPSPAAILSAQAEAAITDMWAQSSQEVVSRGSARVCHQCALPVSTHARFCRRCGTQQY